MFLSVMMPVMQQEQFDEMCLAIFATCQPSHSQGGSCYDDGGELAGWWDKIREKMGETQKQSHAHTPLHFLQSNIKVLMIRTK